MINLLTNSRNTLEGRVVLGIISQSLTRQIPVSLGVKYAI